MTGRRDGIKACAAGTTHALDEQKWSTSGVLKHATSNATAWCSMSANVQAVPAPVTARNCGHTVAKTQRLAGWQMRQRHVRRLPRLADSLLALGQMAQRRRSLACLLTFAVAAAPGCAASTYQIKHSELERLASLPPESRGASVRVEQELSGSEVETQPEVTSDTQIVFFPRIVVTRDYAPPRDAHQVGTRPNMGSHSNPGRGGSGHSGGGSSVGGGGSGGGGKIADDAKAAAIVAIAVAVTAVVVVAVIEGSRFHGDVQLHPMHPVHLFGRDGNYVAMPLAALDPNVVAWADHAVVRRDEGPWQELARAPLVREGWSYGVMMGAATLKSADGSVATGASTSIELGRYFNQQIGLFAFAQFGWRTNAAGAWCDSALLVESRTNLFATEAFARGAMEAQDEGSQLLADLAVPRDANGTMKSGTVIDVCAGAGGKTLAIAARMQNRGRVLASDIDGNKLEELRRRARRGGVSIAQAAATDGNYWPTPIAGALGKADVVLVDAPCSGVGALRRNPEARFRMRESDIADFAAKQRTILDRAFELCAPGGVVVYATCTVLRAENQDVVASVLAKPRGLRAIPLAQHAPEISATFDRDGAFLAVPHRHNTDGFFAQVIARGAQPLAPVK